MTDMFFCAHSETAAASAYPFSYSRNPTERQENYGTTVTVTPCVLLDVLESGPRLGWMWAVFV